MKSLKAHEILRHMDKNGNLVLTVTDCKREKLKVTLCKKVVQNCVAHK